MAKQAEITLTETELTDLKDEIRFRTMVMITLKSLKDIPKRVDSLAFQAKFQWVLITGIILSFIGVAIRVVAR